MPPQNAVILVGSSIIDKWHNISSVSKKPIINLGIGGLITEQILDKSYLTNLGMIKIPKSIIYYCGNNDLLHNISPKQIVKNITTFFAQIQKTHRAQSQSHSHTQFIYLSLTKSPKKYEQHLQTAIDYINHQIYMFCVQHQILYIDTNKLLTCQTDFLKDGVHLSSRGYTKLNNVLLSSQII